jgi:hypothetical protein
MLRRAQDDREPPNWLWAATSKVTAAAPAEVAATSTEDVAVAVGRGTGAASIVVVAAHESTDHEPAGKPRHSPSAHRWIVNGADASRACAGQEGKDAQDECHGNEQLHASLPSVNLRL